MSREVIKIILRRLLNMFISIVIAFVLIFILIYSAPGKEYYNYLNPNMNAELIQKLDDQNQISVINEILKYADNFLHGNLGSSIHYHQNISELIFEHLYVTLILTLSAFSIQFILSLLLAFYSIKKKGGVFFHVLDKLFDVVYSLPTIVTAPLLIIIFSVTLKLFPSSGISGFGETTNIFEMFYYLTLPVLSLVISFVPEYYRYFTDILASISSKEFVLYLKSLGVSNTRIFFHHILPNSLTSILTFVGVDLGYLLTGALITEVIFGIPGIGRLTYESIWSKDFYLAISCSLYGSVIFIASNFITDLIRYSIDKRTMASLQ